jgi:predicted dithiol-disulfide oxidoreductase (DUF899 family)
MPEHRIGTRKEWQPARDELARLEAEQADRKEEIKSKRLDLPWVRVEKEYEFDTEDGLALTEEQAEQIPELSELIDTPPGWLQEWSGQIGAEL